MYIDETSKSSLNISWDVVREQDAVMFLTENHDHIDILACIL